MNEATRKALLAYASLRLRDNPLLRIMALPYRLPDEETLTADPFEGDALEGPPPAFETLPYVQPKLTTLVSLPSPAEIRRVVEALRGRLPTRLFKLPGKK